MKLLRDMSPKSSSLNTTQSKDGSLNLNDMVGDEDEEEQLAVTNTGSDEPAAGGVYVNEAIKSRHIFGDQKSRYGNETKEAQNKATNVDSTSMSPTDHLSGFHLERVLQMKRSIRKFLYRISFLIKLVMKNGFGGDKGMTIKGQNTMIMVMWSDVEMVIVVKKTIHIMNLATSYLLVEIQVYSDWQVGGSRKP
nr:hypothetical protein [Tanacetum cinerariifolium]